jgi:hypothetical protein
MAIWSSSVATTFLVMASKPKIAVWPRGMIGTEMTDPNGPGFVML